MPEVCAYVNRLSDYLFVLSRKMLFIEGKMKLCGRNVDGIENIIIFAHKIEKRSCYKY